MFARAPTIKLQLLGSAFAHTPPLSFIGPSVGNAATILPADSSALALRCVRVDPTTNDKSSSSSSRSVKQEQCEAGASQQDERQLLVPAAGNVGALSTKHTYS